MWLEIKTKGDVKILNTKMVSYICKSIKNSNVIVFLSDKKEIHLECDDPFESAALIQGFILALNGLDFKMPKIEGEYDADMDYIKPLKDDADQALYKYMKLKELLGDRC